MTNPTPAGAEVSAAGNGNTNFEATPDSMLAQSKALNTAASELDAVIRALGLVPCGSEATFGEGGAAAAYTQFFTQWTAELRIQVDALREVSKGVSTAAKNYDKLDHSLHEAWPHGSARNGGSPSSAPTPPPATPLSPVGRTLQEMTVFPGPTRAK